MPAPQSPIDKHTGRTPLQRDGQQWVLDYLVQETGKPFHFQGDARGALPRSVHTHAMIPQHFGTQAQRLEGLADLAYDAGHRHTALDLYFDAAMAYAAAQHVVFALNDEKRFLYAGLRRCYAKVTELAPYRIEQVDIPWEGTVVSGDLHLNPHVDGPAPLVFSIRGCDVTKEGWPHPLTNQAHQRGMHLFSFEGPGQAAATIRGVRLTADNYEHAASAALSHLLTRPEIDPDRVVVLATSFGSFWGMRFAAHDDRIRAIAAPGASLCDKHIHMDLESPRWKQLFAFLTQARTEEELDATIAGMTMHGYMEQITCPVVMTVGEFDPRAPLDATYELFDELTAPAELWVMAGQHHMPTLRGGDGFLHPFMLDWLADRLAGRPVTNPGQVRWVDRAAGPYGTKGWGKRAWYES